MEKYYEIIFTNQEGERIGNEKMILIRFN